MANKIKKMKLKMNNETFNDIDIGVDAANVDMNINEENINLQEYIASLEARLSEFSDTKIEWNKGLDLTE